jgi:hypothetical protein
MPTSLDITISREQLVARPGEIVNYFVNIINRAVIGSQIGCNTLDVTADFFCPGPTGQSDGASTNLITNLDIAAGVTLPEFGPLPCTMPDIDPGVAFAGVRGDGILDDGLLSPFDIDKDIGVLVSTCAVQVDKQISCDGGATWVDAGLVLVPTDDGANGCTAVDGTPILVRYQVNNAGQVPLHACVLTETNTAFGAPGSVPTPLAPGATTAFIPAPQTPLCSNSLEANEPNTASVSCFCQADLNPDDKVSASDSADLTCVTPELNVDKVCVDANSDGIGLVTVTASAVGSEANLVDCAATDRLFRDDPTCPANVGEGTPVPLAPANPFTILAGGQRVLTGLTPAPPLSANACNTVSVTCTIEGTDETITASDDAVCPGAGKGCLTRTPGFWGNHPHITDDFLPLTVCGVALNTVDAGSGTSATEAICSVGRDGQILGPQLTQLVRQCTAALLNVAASASDGGNCLADSPPLTSLLNGCCGAASVCTGDPVAGLTIQSCIDQLDAFNNSPDTLPPFGPFVSPGPADSSLCRDSRNNGVVVTPAP